MANSSFNRAWMTTSTTGSGTITLGSAVAGYQTFAAAGVANAQVVDYVILDGTSAWEIGTGTYTSSGTTLSRTLGSSSTGSLLVLAGPTTVFISPNASDLVTNGGAVTLGVANGGTGQTTFTAGQLLFGNGTTNVNASANLTWDNTNFNLGLGGSALSYVRVYYTGTLGSNAGSSYGNYFGSTIPAASTTSAAAFNSAPATAASAFTLGLFYHFSCSDISKGSGSAVTNQYGHYCGALTSGTNNYGFHSNCAAGANTWNFYSAGTADCFFNGNITTNGIQWNYAPAPTSIAAVTTLTAAQLLATIINTTGTSYTVTLPTGTAIDAGFTTLPGTSIGFDFFVVNTASGTITIAVNTGVTSVGTLTVATATSGHFRLRRTAAATYVLYRLT